ncbi:MAG: bifunctional riboflavin kinase/FAD synthetase [Nannocystaceae bacterium]
MLVLSRPAPLPAQTAACIGAFDGLHRGHQALLARARVSQPNVALVTFVPHPMQVLAPDRAPPTLQTTTQRRRVARWLGLNAVVELPFDEEVSLLSPADFVTRYLLEGLKPASVVVGDDFRFGHRRAGTLSLLETTLSAHSIPLEIVPKVLDSDGAKLGSSVIRAHLQRGEVELAAAILGRPHCVEGRVVHGARRGRRLGFPTANIVSDGAMLPGRGVYAVCAQITDPKHPDAGLRRAGVANIGTNPTFTGDSETSLSLEVHLLDTAPDLSLYDHHVEVGFVARIREERRFDGEEQLCAQIDEDVARAHALMESSDSLHFAPPVMTTTSEESTA